MGPVSPVTARSTEATGHAFVVLRSLVLTEREQFPHRAR